MVGRVVVVVVVGRVVVVVVVGHVFVVVVVGRVVVVVVVGVSPLLHGIAPEAGADPFPVKPKAVDCPVERLAFHPTSETLTAPVAPGARVLFHALATVEVPRSKSTVQPVTPPAPPVTVTAA